MHQKAFGPQGELTAPPVLLAGFNEAALWQGRAEREAWKKRGGIIPYHQFLNLPLAFLTKLGTSGGHWTKYKPPAHCLYRRAASAIVLTVTQA